MPGGRVVAVGYGLGEEFEQINREVLSGDAEVAFLAGLAEGERREVLRRATAVLSWHLAREFPGGLAEAERLEFLQLLSAGVVDELCLTVSPVLVGGRGPRMTGWDEPQPALGLDLLSVCEADGVLLLRYAAKPASQD